jgi:hypothetical protein
VKAAVFPCAPQAAIPVLLARPGLEQLAGGRTRRFIDENRIIQHLSLRDPGARGIE